ncbi:hypothetical protein HPB50_025362 [Hyalomma asiaticum]|uniref:Uncharacterized protein n=1 Tax=Hyalomma asiaticum TaxID=266040 RepID=A0ACB7SZL6_HYAAI|nr:hypothetical protein HPB50_025362 [Hyalomma asiaticum]
MEKIKAKRTVRRRQNTVIINEATAALETADAEELAAILHRLEISNGELRKLNEEMEVHIAADAFEDEYTEVTQYDDRAHRIIGLLQARIAAARLLLPSPQANSMRRLEAARGPSPKHRCHRATIASSKPGLELLWRRPTGEGIIERLQRRARARTPDQRRRRLAKEANTASRRRTATAAPPAERLVEAGGSERRHGSRDPQSQREVGERARNSNNDARMQRGARRRALWQSDPLGRHAGPRLRLVTRSWFGPRNATTRRGGRGQQSFVLAGAATQPSEAFASLTTDATGPAVARRARKSRGFL